MKIQSRRGFFAEIFYTFDPVQEDVNVYRKEEDLRERVIGNFIGDEGIVADNLDQYKDLIDDNNLAQNSWSPDFFINFDPTVKGEYTILLQANSKTDLGSAGPLVGETEIVVKVVPEPSAVAGISLGAVGVLLWIRRRITRSV